MSCQGLPWVALIAAVLAAAVGWLNPSMATPELAALLTALALGVANHRRRWHQHWIEYRLVEELWRKRQALARVGWSSAARGVRRMTGNTAPRTERAETAPPGTAWVSWFFNAAMWASPVPVGALSGDGLRAIPMHSPTPPMTHNDTPGRRSAVKGLG